MKFINDKTFHVLLPNEPALFIPILSDPKKYYVENRLSFIYIYTLQTWNEFILGLNHNDTYGFDMSILNEFQFRDVYCYKKKYLGRQETKYKAYEAELVVWFNTNKKLEAEIPLQVRQYWNWYPNLENVNDCIPIMKWLEYCRNVKDRFIIQYNNFELDESFLKYNQLLTDLEEIERNGLFIKI